jgi:hypothetical protein
MRDVREPRLDQRLHTRDRRVESEMRVLELARLIDDVHHALDEVLASSVHEPVVMDDSIGAGLLGTGPAPRGLLDRLGQIKFGRDLENSSERPSSLPG